MTTSLTAMLSATVLGLGLATASMAQDGHQHGHDSGHGNSHDHVSGMAAAAASAALDPWLGEWRSGDVFVGDALLYPLYASVADRLPGWTASDVRNWTIDVRRDDFGVVRVGADNAVTYLEDDFQTPICAATYAHRGAAELSNGKGTLPVGRFEMVEGRGECEPFRFLVMVGIHGSAPGWHFRYGTDGFEPLEADAWGGWWPVLLASDATAETLKRRWDTHVEDFVNQLRDITPKRERPARPWG